VRTYRDLTEPDRSDLLGQVLAQRAVVAGRLAEVGHVVAVMSGKGGVGKSFVTAGLAAALAGRGRVVGVLDADLQGPTAARMLGVRDQRLVVREDGVEPVLGVAGVRVMSSDLLLEEGAPLAWKEPGHERFVWRGALEAGMLREFLADVRWGRLDVLLVDLPPGTGRLDTLAEFAPGMAGVVAVTLPSEASLRAVRRALVAARASGIRVLGVVENMAGYVCGECGVAGPLFQGDAGAVLSREAGSPLLARVPFDPRAQAAADQGRPLEGAGSAAALAEAAAALDAALQAP
jgi:ATP-binding protein involved in chromosome partitioning